MGWGSWCRLAVDNWILLPTPSNQFSLLLCIRARTRCRDGPVHVRWGSQVSVTASASTSAVWWYLCFWKYRARMPKIMANLPLKRVFSCPLHASVLLMNLHSHRELPPRPIDSSGRICRSVGGFVGLCKRPRKMFSDKLFSIPQSLLGRALHHAAWCITHSRCLFASLYLSHPLLFPSISQSLFQHALFASVSSLARTFSVSCNTELHTPRDGPASWASCLR